MNMPSASSRLFFHSVSVYVDFTRASFRPIPNVETPKVRCLISACTAGLSNGRHSMGTPRKCLFQDNGIIDS